jgi:glucose/arabinose dehydrogenase
MLRSPGGGCSCRAANLAVFVWLTVVVLPRLARAVELPPGFVAETIATNLNAATAIAPSPDGRIFIADQTGKLLAWKDGRLLDTPALTLHVTDYWERGLIGLTLDPDFPRAPFLYILYVTDRPLVHHVLSRFAVEGDRVDPGSERILIEGDDQATLGGSVPAGHQGGALRFDSDGRLYVSIGEQTAGEPSQRLDTLQGKILRLNRDGSIPADNPFFNETTGKYRSIYARGVRNSFGIAAQSKADGGRMFFTDVGGSAFEEVNELKPGENYGWPGAEGFSTNAAFRNPLHAYPPMVGQSIVGGAFTPRLKVQAQSSNWPEKWSGRFFFADFMKHWIKALDPDAPTNVLTFARGLNGPVATEFAPDGSLLVLNRGAIWRDPKKFVPNAGSLVRIRSMGEGKLAGPAPSSDSARLTNFAALGLPMSATLLPKKLARAEWELRSQGVRRWPMWINSRPWHHLVRENVVGLYLPDGAKVSLADPSADATLPPGAVVVRNFSVSTAWTNRPPRGNPERRIETRLLVIGKPYSYGVSYRWRGEEAELVEDSELATLSDLADERGEGQPPRTASVNWWFPALDDAISFPIINPAYWISTAPLDFVTVPPQLRSVPPVNWLAAMLGVNALETKFASGVVSNLPPGTVWESPLAPLEARVRSYLHGNCAVCHQPGGASRGNLDLRLTTPLALTGLVNGEAVAGDLGIAGAKVLAPGSPEKSLLYQRVKRTDFFRMPPVAYHNELSPILPLMEEWIRSLDQTTKVNQPPR